jgi:general secretion pathway protein D
MRFRRRLCRDRFLELHRKFRVNCSENLHQVFNFRILDHTTMKSSSITRSCLCIVLVISMLSPVAVLAGDGKKFFKQGMKHEVAEEWDKAVEAFALAVADNPKNPEYKLHLQRALFNASQMYMKKGRVAADEKDYEGAYIAFRKAYGFDPVNELAKAEMARMLRLQEETKKDGSPDPNASANGTVKLVPTSLDTSKPDFPMPQKLEKLRDLPFPSGVNLQFIVKELARDLDLNVLFDVESRLEQRQVRIELRNVTAAKALDYIFLQENLFFQKVGPRTILVANGTRRMNFQQLVLRTFYLANASPKDVAAIVKAAIPPQPGRISTIVLEDAATNSITIRDTQENIRLIGKLISSLDKDRAEVVMDVSIYEVNKNDLLQFGNQIGTAGQNGTLLNLGGVGFRSATGGSDAGGILSGLPFTGLSAASIAFGLPVSSIAALQNKNDTKLIASTQIHAFNNEDSTARIGQRVPVRTATFQTGNNTGSGVVSDVINYEQVGLTLKFKPIVFPNQDVQVGMEIESKDVSGASTLTPVFTERKITGSARIQNNKTLLLASVAQGIESKGRTGLPLLGLIPIIGRLFTAPTRDNRQIDIVIAITPRVIRAPSILPEDEIERPTGSVQVPTSGSLEAMIIQEEREEYLASARRLSNTAKVQLPDRPVDVPAYVRNGETSSVTSGSPATGSPNGLAAPTSAESINLKPIDTSVKTLQIAKTSDDLLQSNVVPITNFVPAAKSAENVESPTIPTAEVLISSAIQFMKKGDRARIPIMVTGSLPFRSAVLGVKFDNAKMSVRTVQMGDVFGSTLAEKAVAPFLNQNGKMYVSLSMPEGTVVSSTGTLAFIEVEALVDGKPEMVLDREVLNLLTSDGKNFQFR